MKIIDYIKRKLKKEAQSRELISVTDLLRLPLKKDIEDNVLLEEINKQEEEYEYLLGKREYQELSHHNLEEIRHELDKVLTIVENIIIGSNLQNIILREETPSSMLQQTKLAIYRNDVLDKERETYAKLIALQELKSKIFISKKRKNSIQKESDYLAGVYLALKNVRAAIDLKIDAYLKEITISNEENDEENIEERDKSARRIISIILPEKLKEIKKLNLSKSTELAVIETTLEKFAYDNKEKIESIKERLEGVSSKEELEDMEIYYLLYAVYGRNFITEHEMASFYEKRFEILTQDISEITKPFVDENTNSLEKICYEELISSKARNILKTRGELIRLVESQEIYANVERIVRKALNMPEETLNNPLELALLLSLERKNGLKTFFETYSIEPDKIEDNIIKEMLSRYSDVFTWEKKIPLKTMMWLLSRGKEKFSKADIEDEQLRIFYDIYNCLYKQDENVYTFPEGLVSIDVRTINDDGDPSDSLMNKDIICPSSLKKLKLDYRNVKPYGKIQLNEGLEFLYLKVSTRQMKELVIPSSVKTLSIDSPSYIVFDNEKKGIETLIFNDYKNSNFLKNKEALIRFIKENFYAEKTGHREYHTPSDYVLQKQKDYWEGRYSTFVDMDLFDHPYTKIEYKIVPEKNSPKMIVLVDEDGTQTTIDLESLDVTFWRKESYHLVNKDSDISDKQAEILIDKIKEQVAKKDIQYTKKY